jgi:hypothetical protein
MIRCIALAAALLLASAWPALAQLGPSCQNDAAMVEEFAIERDRGCLKTR